MKVQRELDETKITLHKTIESLLERNVKLDDLVNKSEGLSSQSKMFYTQVCPMLCSVCIKFETNDVLLYTRRRSKILAVLLCNIASPVSFLPAITGIFNEQYHLTSFSREKLLCIRYEGLPQRFVQQII